MERPIEAILDTYTLEDLQDRIEDVAKQYKHILGVLAIGSLVQLSTPKNFYIPRHTGKAGMAYESIRRPLRRKDTACKDSDLDIWICTEDTASSEHAKPQADKGGSALVEELASGTLEKGTSHWQSKKLQAFGHYYKQLDLYHTADGQLEPWLADDFKTELEEVITSTMPKFAQNINKKFSKKIPGNFLEVRAYPESLFNLRPDEAQLANGTEDRAPFPRIADDQWISIDHNAHIFYAKDSISIYPFRDDGEVLGEAIGQHIDELAKQEEDKTSMGGIMLKPDALQAADLPIIKEKIRKSIIDAGGRIIIDQRIDKLQNEEIDEIYPLLDQSDIADVRKYLQSGPIEIIIVELPCDPYETFRIVNGVKGARVGDRSIDRLAEGRILNGAVRDLLPLPGDEERYKRLIPTILEKRTNPNVRFSDEDYSYYVQNLMHTPDNTVELSGLRSVGRNQQGASHEESKD